MVACQLVSQYGNSWLPYLFQSVSCIVKNNEKKIFTNNKNIQQKSSVSTSRHSMKVNPYQAADSSSIFNIFNFLQKKTTTYFGLAWESSLKIRFSSHAKICLCREKWKSLKMSSAEFYILLKNIHFIPCNTMIVWQSETATPFSVHHADGIHSLFHSHQHNNLINSCKCSSQTDNSAFLLQCDSKHL